MTFAEFRKEMQLQYKLALQEHQTGKYDVERTIAYGRMTAFLEVLENLKEVVNE